jgi:hypothetical protein
VYALAGAIEPAAERLRALGVPLTTLPRRRSYEPGRVVALARAFRRDGIDLVHAILPAGAAYGSLAARLAGIPIVIVSARAGDPSEGRPVRRVLHRLYRQATVILANTRAHACRVAAESHVPLEHVQVVYDGVELSGHRAPSMLDGLRERVWHRPLVIGGAGDADHGRAALLRGARNGSSRAIPARTSSGSTTTTAPRRRRHRRTCRSASRPSPTIPCPCCASSPCSALRRRPTCPALDLVPAALAAGRPVIAAGVPGIDELVTDGATGAVVPAGDPDALAAAAFAFLEDRGRLRTAGHAARAHAEQALGADTMARATAAVYEATLLGQPAPGPALAAAAVAAADAGR